MKVWQQREDSGYHDSQKFLFIITQKDCETESWHDGLKFLGKSIFSDHWWVTESEGDILYELLD